MSDLLSGQCQQCGGEFDFAASDAGAIGECPHCGKDTLFQVAGETVAEAAAEDTETPSSPRSSRRWLVVAGIAFAVLALAGTAAAFYVKRSNGGGSSGVRSAANNPAALAAEAETAKDVMPVIAAYQGGQTADQIRRGRDVFWNSCSECHRFYDPSFYTSSQWSATLGNMRGKAKLNAAQYDDLLVFVKSLREP